MIISGTYSYYNSSAVEKVSTSCSMLKQESRAIVPWLFLAHFGTSSMSLMVFDSPHSLHIILCTKPKEHFSDLTY
jgi:hypothetical protein